MFVSSEIPVISSDVTLPKEIVLLSTLVASTVISSGAINVGLVVSITKIFWVVLAELPDKSSAIHVIIDSPYGKTNGAFVEIVTFWTSFTVGASSGIELS